MHRLMDDRPGRNLNDDPGIRITDSREHLRDGLLDQRRPVPRDGSSARASR